MKNRFFRLWPFSGVTFSTFLSSNLLVISAALLAMVFFSSQAVFVFADSAEEAWSAIPWTEGPAVGEMGPWAQIQVPENYLFTGPEGTQKVLELTENPPDPETVGVLIPTGETENWMVFFDYSDSGHVKDDERDSIDGDALLESLKTGTEAGNEERRANGWDSLHVTDWIVPPGYEPSTNRLAWGVRMRQGAGDNVANYDVRVLGRTGVMSVTLTCSPDQVKPLIPVLQELLNGFDFKAGQKYAEWRSGDKMAAYGLTGLIVGGAAVGAAKLGFFAKFFAVIAKFAKVVILALLAFIGAIWKLFTGKKTDEQIETG